jgi:E3 ubiquitin-protein ligase DOA10
MEYLVIECRNRESTLSIRNTNHLGEKNGVYQVDEVFSGTCKICLSDETSPDNILLSPCKCKGSCELVHMGCLKVWIDSKVKKQVSGVVSTYNFTKFEC